jgi:SAM-dependent methyltransferase
MDARQRFTSERVAHWELVAASSDSWRGLGSAYHKRLQRVYRHLIGPGRRVLEVGCGTGDLLAAVQPSFGVGLDFSPGMIRRARKRHPDLSFAVVDAHDLPLRSGFDAIILSDLFNDVWDVQEVLDRLSQATTPRTRVILNLYSRLWEQPLALAEALGLAKPVLHQNWLTFDDIQNLMRLEGFSVLRRWREFMFPIHLPLIAPFCNRFLVRLWPFQHLSVANFVMAAPMAHVPKGEASPSVSVIVPARNERGNIAPLLDQLPPLGRHVEVIFVEGHSRDGTSSAIEDEIARRPERRIMLLRQDGQGKGDAVRKGFAAASGELLVILDADLSVRPQDLPRFVDALAEGKAEFVNGVRLVYPMEGEAMRFLNLVGNKVFGYLFSWMLGQPIKDTLCGTKALWNEDYRRIAAGREYFGEFDPFGDYDLLFGAAKMGLRIVDIPVRYQQRVYGRTNIDRWRHGLLLLRMVIFAARRLKFT